ncbi:MAG TPA: lysylphosphatidylglycerol synthase transmembrane domain-containing protein [Bacteroidales bacterium]|nr:lysylphosphatidylglycerol synthase transmembrane domain-containing protein [Bacteroidales bacterium]
MKKKVIQVLKFLAFLLVGLLILWLAFRRIDFRKLWLGLEEANYIWILFALLFAGIAYASRARRWTLLIHAMGYDPSFGNAFYAMMTGYLANLALPRIGEISRCVALGKKENIPVDRLIGTVVIERAVDIFSLLSIMIVMLFIEGGIIGPFIEDYIYTPVHEELISVFGSTWIFWLIFFILVTILIYAGYRWRNRLRKIRFFEKLFEAAKGVIHGLKTITKLHRKWEFILHTVLIWFSYAMMTWLVVFAVKATSHLDIADGLFLLVIGGIAMSAPVQSGLGVFHFIISRALFVVYGISLEDGLVYALLTHESQVIFGTIIGIYSFYALVRKSPPAPLKGN